MAFFKENCTILCHRFFGNYVNDYANFDEIHFFSSAKLHIVVKRSEEWFKLNGFNRTAKTDTFHWFQCIYTIGTNENIFARDQTMGIKGNISLRSAILR